LVEEGAREGEPLDGAGRGLGEGPEEADDERRAGDGELEAPQGEGDAELEEVPPGELAALPPPLGLGEVRLDDALLAEVDEDVLGDAEAELDLLQGDRLLGLRGHDGHRPSWAGAGQSGRCRRRAQRAASALWGRKK